MTLHQCNSIWLLNINWWVVYRFNDLLLRSIWGESFMTKLDVHSHPNIALLSSQTVLMRDLFYKSDYSVISSCVLYLFLRNQDGRFRMLGTTLVLLTPVCRRARVTVAPEEGTITCAWLKVMKCLREWSYLFERPRIWILGRAQIGANVWCEEQSIQR